MKLQNTCINKEGRLIMDRNRLKQTMERWDPCWILCYGYLKADGKLLERTVGNLISAYRSFLP